MSQKPKILPLAAALAALAGPSAVISPAEAARIEVPTSAKASMGRGIGQSEASDVAANRLVAVGDDVLAFLVTELEDGTVVAQHRSHYSHRSHSSHRSHYSSR